MRLVGQAACESGCIISKNRADCEKMQPERERDGPTCCRGTTSRMNAATSAENNLADLMDVARVLAGDVRAFEGIVRRWQGPLINMAWRYCRDRGRAEEMAQDAFLRAWRGLSHWRRESSFSTWLFALAANVYRSELKRFPTETLPLEAAPEPAGLATQHSELAAQLSHDAVHRAVLALPLRYRERWFCSTFMRWMWPRLRRPWACPKEP